MKSVITRDHGQLEEVEALKILPSRSSFRGEGGRPVGVHQRKAIPVRGKRANNRQGAGDHGRYQNGAESQTADKRCRAVL